MFQAFQISLFTAIYFISISCFWSSATFILSADKHKKNHCLFFLQHRVFSFCCKFAGFTNLNIVILLDSLLCWFDNYIATYLFCIANRKHEKWDGDKKNEKTTLHPERCIMNWFHDQPNQLWVIISIFNFK